ncbi:uncharacterized protein LOC129910537 isoform X2 [Episyrphus balteatus]|nr:uncharacterized protein LOC129910537 isoform X2 [Episyrphus balteatus]
MIHIKPLGLLFLLIFFYWFYKNIFSVQIIPPDELQLKMKALMERVETTRAENPALFCLVASSSLGALAVLGHYLSGSTVVLICLIAAVIFSTKYNFKILKRKKIDNTNLIKLQENEFDEFLPEVNESNMSLLERASDQSSVALPAEEGEEKSEEIPSFLMIPDCIPEIDENSTDEDDALGIGVPDEILNEHRSRSAEIEFKKGHFKKDSSVSTSSSSDEENLSKGLKFPDHSNVEDHGSSTTQSKQSELSQQMQQSLIMSRTILPSLVTGLVSWAGGSSAVATAAAVAIDNHTKSELHRVGHDDNNKTYSDEDESDYEIVNTDEYQ